MKNRRKNIVIIGAGYVGLVSGTCFAEFGRNVIIADKDEDKVKKLKKGEIPIYEPGLEKLVKKNIRNGKLSFQVNYSESLESTDIIFIAVGTPSRRGDGHADLTYVYQVAEEIALSVDKDLLIVNKSTVPVGTAREVEKIVKK